MNSKKLTAQALLELLEYKLAQGHYNDSVHKIKLMTARDVIKKILETEFNA
ncbi:MAG: hypothetical protein ACPHIT_07090 [Flavobacteriaceae bacterium]